MGYKFAGFTLKNNLEFYRMKSGYNQNQLASFVGTTKNIIASIEYGIYMPSAHLAYLLCNVLCCKFEDLFYLQFEGNS